MFLPEGYTVRCATIADSEAVAELVRASELDVRHVSSIDAGDVRDWWRPVDLERDTWVVHDDGNVAAAATFWPHGEVPHVWGDVQPVLRGRGLGTALLHLTEARARDHGSRAVRNDVFSEDEIAIRLLEGSGYREVRRFLEMAIELGDERPPEPEWPEGLTADRFRLEDAEAFHAALLEAFEDDWGFSPMPFEQWRKARLEAEDFDPTVWTVVRDGDEIVAVARCDVRRYGSPWVATLGVRKPWRRRGLGLALLQRTFRLFHERGERRVALGVDAENPSGATRLYERAGMKTEVETITFEKQL